VRQLPSVSKNAISLNHRYLNVFTNCCAEPYNKPPLGTGNGNPASFYCTELGGSDSFGGVNAAGGGWVGKNSIDEVLEACIFPDMSSIDSWGLTYNTEGIIRGIDLTTVMRYHFSPTTSTSPAP
jgi:putative hemolysin